MIFRKGGGMKHVSVLMLFFATLQLITTNINAQTFSDVSPSGHTLEYSILDETSVKVTGVTGSSTGFITIPAIVSNSGTTYLVTQIGYAAFMNCNMTSISIPGTMALINKRVFWYCNNLQNVYIMTIGQPIIGYNAFDNTPSSLSINYPCGSNGVAYYYSVLSGHNITITPNDSSMGEVAPISIDLGATDTMAVLQATSNYGYHFVGWNDGYNNPIRSIPMVNNATYTAIFAKNVYPINGYSSETDRGYVTGVSFAEYLDTITLTAISNYGYHFARWQNNSTINPIQIVVTDTVNMVAYFDNNLYNISLDVDTSIHGNCSGDGDFPYLSYHDISANGNYGYHFSHWNDGNTNNPRTIQVFRDSSFTAYFDKNMYSVVGLSTDTAKGIVLGSDTLDYLDTAVLTALPFYGYHFDHWSDDGSAEPTHSVVANMDKTIYAWFSTNQYLVQISVSNNTYGNTSGSTTNGQYDYLSNINLVANASNGYHFLHWSDGDTNNPRTITLTQDTLIMAVFAKNSYCVTGLSDNEEKGSVTGSDTVDYLDTVILTAIPNYGYHFARWNDNNTNNPRHLIATQNQSLTAYFGHNQYTIVLNVDTNIHGMTVGGGSYNYLSERTITATANYGYHFTSWNDGDTNNPRVITMVQDTSFTALFAKNTYTITAISDDTIRGVVTGSTLTEYLDSVTIVAIPNYGYHFTAWNDGDTTNPRTIETIKDSLFTAYFDYNQYSITLNVDTNIHGSVTGGGLYNYTSEQTITATPNYGYHFTSWNDGDTTNPRTITLTQDSLFTALFAKNSYSVSVVSADTIWGNVTGNTTTEYLNAVSIAATANYGYHFLHWNDGDTTNPRVITLTQDTLLTAYFAKNWYSVICISDNETMGYVTGSDTAEYLDSVSLLASSNYGYHFSSWNDGDTNNPRVVCLTQDTSFTALFAKNQYTLTVQSNDEIQGSVSDGGVFDYLDTATIIASASEHYHFVRWDDGNMDNPREYVIVGDATLTAIFAIDTHTVTVTANDIARGMAEATGTEFVYGTPCTVTATAYTGYVFSRWSNGITANPYTFAVLEDTELTAIFEEEGTQGIDDVFDINGFVVYYKGRSIYICGIEGQPLSVYGIDGRIIVTKHRATEQETIHAPSTGVYFIKVGEYPARKVVVVR